MRTLLPIAALLLVTPAVAGKKKQAPPAEAMADTAALVVGRALGSREHTWTRMQELCDDIGHRLSGTPALERAVEWGRERMVADGLAARLEPVKVPHWVRGEESLTLLGAHPRELPMLGIGNSVGTPAAGIEAEVVVVGSFDELTALGDGARGRIVLFDVPFTDYGQTVRYRGGGASEAARAGAVAALVRSVTPTSLATPHTGAMGYADDVAQIPAAAVDIETATQLRRMATAGKAPRVRLKMGAKMIGEANSHNVVGEIRGRELPDEIVVVGCHLDSWDVGQGAQDDAAGCVAAMEAGRVIAGLAQRPRRTVRVVLFTNEENGLRGGFTYQEAHEREKHVAAIEMDTGAGAFLGFRVDARPGPDPDANAAESARMVAALDPVKPLFDSLGTISWVPAFSGSDVMPLVNHGTLGFGIHMDTTGYWPIHHTEADTLDKIDRDDFQRDIAGMTLLAWVLAEMPRVPQVQPAAGGNP
jgi:carboxypeptidase Q